ncbi:hypothetical protein L9Z73_03360 [Pseudomonas sp. TNT11]|uniref:Phage tail protein n=1 Tax=Pseudomonas emilianonis TaxID=2915812 RepID=A0ABT0ED35_9PSED|nr:hypothetical protein [Pseudomonas emilianonis]MCK1783431.1 hypothetical protein [Pseudomonas emilianonis]
MPTNDFLPFGSAVGANVSTQAEYVALAARANGFTAGTAVSKQLNKAWRQSSVISATLAQFIADQSGNDVLDDGNLATIQTNLGLAIKAAIASGIPYATQVQAEAGTSTTTVMSPLRVFQAIAKVVTQATESMFGWLKIATQALVNAGVDDSTALTPKKLATAIQSQALTAFTTAGSSGALTLTPVPAVQLYAAPLRFRVKFSQNSTGTDTINVSGLGVKSLKQYDPSGAKLPAVFAANQLSDIEYDGTDFVLLDQLPTTVSQGIRGNAAKLFAAANGTSANVVLTADMITVANAAGNCLTLRTISLTLNTAATASATVSGMTTGAVAVSTVYAGYIWYNSTTGAMVATGDSSFVTPTAPAAGFDYWCRWGSFRTDGTANKYPLNFTQAGRRCRYRVAAGTNVAGLPLMGSGTAGSTSAPTWVGLSVAGFAPPTAISVSIVLSVQNGASAIVAPNNAYGPWQSSSNSPPVAIGANATLFSVAQSADIQLEQSNIIYWASSTASNILTCSGWEDSF